jgi:hypothetical protein
MFYLLFIAQELFYFSIDIHNNALFNDTLSHFSARRDGYHWLFYFIAAH